MKKSLIIAIACIALLGACATTGKTSSAAVYAPGEYSASADGMDGEIQVKVTVDASKILSVVVVKQNETEGIGTVAVEKLPAEFVKANSAKIDGIAGATISSNALKGAVEKALEQAKAAAQH